jgi:hypothetical protein
VTLVPVDCPGDLRPGVEQQDADAAAPPCRAGEDTGDGVVGGVPEFGHAVQPQLARGVTDDRVPLLPGDQAPVSVRRDRLAGTGPGNRMLAGYLGRGQAEDARGDLQRAGEPAQHRDVGQRRDPALEPGHLPG